MSVLPVLLCYLIVRECFYIYSTNKLLDKLMSRNYNEYQYTKNLGKALEPSPKIKVQEEIPEDLGPLHNFGLN